MNVFTSAISLLNDIIWHDYALFVLLGVGILFTIWSGFGQYRALTHGVDVIRGKFDDRKDPGAINHFQALSTALSATVGLGNIAGVALAIALGGPGALFWMWIVGIVGMCLKMTEVTQSMLFRDTSDPKNPHGGPMWSASVDSPR
jgi:alanine or glycine:cation symporter, AGCS family